MDPCYHPNVCNCISDTNCKRPDDNYECCSEISPNVQSKFGVWVKNGTCNSQTGHCKSNRNMLNTITKENFIINTIEGYNLNSNDFLMYLVLFVICIIVLKYFGYFNLF